MGKVLEESLSNFSDRISDAIKARKNILVTTHIDCDGITSGAIISKALIRQGAKCTVRTTNEFSEKLVDKMQKETRISPTGIIQVRKIGYPVCFDATHSIQLPTSMGNISGGQREFIPFLVRAAINFAGADLVNSRRAVIVAVTGFG